MAMRVISSWRNRLLTSRTFRRRVQNLPIVRQFARRAASDLFSKMTGFVHSQVVLACVELNLLDRVAQKESTLDELATSLGLDESRAAALLEAACELGLTERFRDGRFGLGSLGASLLAEPGLLALVRHHRSFYRDLADPVALLRGTADGSALGEFWPYAQSGPEQELQTAQVADYTAVMGESQRMVAEQVLASVSLASCRRLLDVGGGNGSFVAAVARRYPSLELGLMDLPAVTQLAGTHLAGSGLDGRVDLHAGDFHRQPIPTGYDALSLVRILHDHDDAPVRKLLESAYRSLPTGGRLLIAEPLKATPGSREVGALYFSFYLMAMGSGRPRAWPELQSMVTRAGFQQVRLQKTPIPLVCSVITARK